MTNFPIPTSLTYLLSQAFNHNFKPVNEATGADSVFHPGWVWKETISETCRYFLQLCSKQVGKHCRQLFVETLLNLRPKGLWNEGERRGREMTPHINLLSIQTKVDLLKPNETKKKLANLFKGLLRRAKTSHKSATVISYCNQITKITSVSLYYSFIINEI